MLDVSTMPGNAGDELILPSDAKARRRSARKSIQRLSQKRIPGCVCYKTAIQKRRIAVPLLSVNEALATGRIESPPSAILKADRRLSPLCDRASGKSAWSRSSGSRWLRRGCASRGSSLKQRPSRRTVMQKRKACSITTVALTKKGRRRTWAKPQSGSVRPPRKATLLLKPLLERAVIGGRRAARLRGSAHGVQIGLDGSAAAAQRHHQKPREQ